MRAAVRPVVEQPASCRARRSNHRHAQRPLQLARVAPQRARAADARHLADRGVLGARHRPRRGTPRPARPTARRDLRQPQVHVAQLAQGAEQLHLGDRQPGVPEQRQPRRQVEPVAAGAQPLPASRRGARRAAGASTTGDQPAPQLRLPGQVAVDRADPRRRCRAPRASRSTRLRAAARRTTRTARPAAGPPSSAGCAAARPRRRRRRGRGGWPRCAHHGSSSESSMTSSSGHTSRSGSQGSSRSLPSSSATSECGLRKRTPAHTPSPPRAPTPMPVGEPLGQPALHAARRHDHQLLGERVRRAGRRAAPPARPRAGRSARRDGSAGSRPAGCHEPPTRRRRRVDGVRRPVSWHLPYRSRPACLRTNAKQEDVVKKVIVSVIGGLLVDRRSDHDAAARSGNRHRRRRHRRAGGGVSPGRAARSTRPRTRPRRRRRRPWRRHLAPPSPS